MCSRSKEVLFTVESPRRSQHSKRSISGSPNILTARSPRSPSGRQCSSGPGLDYSFEPSYVQQLSFNELYQRPQGTQMPVHSTPYNVVPNKHERLGSQLEYDLNWMPCNFDICSDEAGSSLPTSSQRPRTSSQYSRNAANIGMESSSLQRKFFASDSQIGSPSSPSPKRHNETLLEWFDRSVEKELSKRLEGSLNVGENLVNFDTPSHKQKNISPTFKPSISPGTAMLDHSSSQLDISAKLRSAMDTDLIEAVDKLAKAEAMLTFEGAVRAAEEAAANAPPEYAEEAAAASADGYQAQVTGVVQQEFSGIKPIEVIGYVGITKPKHPKRPFH